MRLKIKTEQGKFSIDVQMNMRVFELKGNYAGKELFKV